MVIIMMLYMYGYILHFLLQRMPSNHPKVHICMQAIVNFMVSFLMNTCNKSQALCMPPIAFSQTRPGQIFRSSTESKVAFEGFIAPEYFHKL